MEYSHLPGCDDVYSWDKDRITPKLASSAARSFGKQDVYCEVFGAYGWDVTLQKMKAVTDWLFSRGVNRLLLSSFYFTMEGDWQFEIPPSLFYQNTLWRYLPNYTNYVQRLSFMLSGGRNVTPIAMLYPNKSVQAVLTPLDEKLADQLDSSFIRLSNFLLSHQLDFDYLNERALIDAAIKTVENKVVLRQNQNDFWIDYKLLLVPLTKIIDEAALQRVNNFYNRGGKIIAYGNLPQLSSEGADLKFAVNKIWRDPAGSNTNNKGGMAFFIKSDFDSVRTIIESCLIPDLRLESHNKNINYIHKIKDGLDIYFISNIDSVPVNTDISFSTKAYPQIWNPENGAISAAKEFRRDGDRTVLPIQLDRFGSLLVIFDPSKPEIPHLIDTNMKVENVEMRNDSILVNAVAIAAGESYIRLKWQKTEFEKAFVTNSPVRIELPDFWNFKPEDNSFPEEIRSSGSWTEEQKIKRPDGSAIAPAHPYFSGTGLYFQKFHFDQSLLKENRKFVLEAGQINNVIEVWLNGKKVGERCWHPFSFDITNYLKAGENEIKLMITNTPANGYMLRSQQYRLGEKWGKVLASGLMEKVKILMYEKYEFSFIN
ncbi:MAG TPA: glycosyl hydrolase, partial [bacterium]